MGKRGFAQDGKTLASSSNVEEIIQTTLQVAVGTIIISNVQNDELAEQHT